MADVGRPSDYTQEKADAICELLTRGWSLRKVIEQGWSEYDGKNGNDKIDFPSIATVFKWMRDYPEFLKQYTRAKNESADAMAEEILELSDKAPQAITGADRSDSARVQAVKLQIDTRKFLMAKMKPKRYGDRLDLTSGGERVEMTPLIVSEIKSRNATPATQSETEASS